MRGMTTGVYLIWVSAAFLSGSIPFAVLLGRLKGVDIRKIGSGNPGATNLGRAVGRKWGFLCFVLDVLKGLLPVLLASLLAFEPLAETENGGVVPAMQWVGIAIAAVCGHIFSPWLGFKGGKGVATGLGSTLGLFPVVTLAGVVAFVVWLGVAKWTGYVGLASVVAALSLPLVTGVNGYLLELSPESLAVFVALTALLAALVVYRHRGNLARIRAGTEPKAGWTGRA